MGESAQLQVLVTSSFLLTTAIAMTALVGYYVIFEVQMYKNSEGKMRMHFVVLTLFLSLTSTCSTWFNSTFYFIYGQTPLNELNAPDTILNIMTATAHVYLLYLRTQGLFATSQNLAKLMKFLGFIFVILSAFNVSVGILVLLGTAVPELNIRVTNFLFVNGTVAMAFVLIMIDSISTYAFGKQVSEQKQMNQKFVQNQDMQIIAKMGLAICVLSITTFVFYTSSYIKSTGFQTLGAAGFILIENCIAGLWVIMKIRLDNLKNKRTNAEPLFCLKWFQDSTKASELQTIPKSLPSSGDNTPNTTVESGKLEVQLGERKSLTSK
jgi:hypothetical protein